MPSPTLYSRQVPSSDGKQRGREAERRDDTKRMCIHKSKTNKQTKRLGSFMYPTATHLHFVKIQHDRRKCRPIAPLKTSTSEGRHVETPQRAVPTVTTKAGLLKTHAPSEG